MDNAEELKIAGRLAVASVMAELARMRPVFHSEADFQFALAWHVKTLDPSIEVSFETPQGEGKRLDLAFRCAELDSYTPVELKYLTRGWAGSVGGQNYALKNHGAQDIRCYDAVADLQRIERFTDQHRAHAGFVIVLTNDPYYWRSPKAIDNTNAAAFRIGDGAELSGERCWGPETGPGTMKGRDATLGLRSRYRMHWADYSEVGTSDPRTIFRYLAIPVVGSR